MASFCIKKGRLVFMERGNLVIYDDLGNIWHQTGYAKGDVLSHEYPEGLPWMEIPYEDGRFVESIDVSKTPHEPIFVTEV